MWPRLWPQQKISDLQVLQEAILELRRAMRSLRLGIMAPSPSVAAATLKAWLHALGLPEVQIKEVDEENQLIEQLEGPVYLKYTYDDDEKVRSAYMKPYPFKGRGVLFNPQLPDGEMRMYGDFPLKLFESSEKP